MAHYQLNALRLVFPPVSNAYAQAMKDEKNHPLPQDSNLYMLARRQEASFKNIKRVGDAAIAFDFVVEGVGTDEVELRFDSAIGYPPNIEIDSDDQSVFVYSVNDEGERQDLFDSFGTEDLLWKKSKGHPGIHGLDRYRDFFSYELLYIGIGGDAFARLVKRPHEKRLEILSTTHSLRPGARVSDELFLFFFRVEPIHVAELEFEDFDSIGTPHKGMRHESVFADAEKALTSVLKPPYNKNLFKEYPDGVNGLYAAGLDRYCYSISEDITLKTNSATIRGAWSASLVGDAADTILVEGQSVELLTPDDMRGRLSSPE